MNKKLLLCLTLDTISIGVFILVLGLQIFKEHLWLIPVALFLMFISQLIHDPDIPTRPIKLKGVGKGKIILFGLLLALAILTMVYREQVDAIYNNELYRIIIIAFFVTAWIYDAKVKLRSKQNT